MDISKLIVSCRHFEAPKSIVPSFANSLKLNFHHLSYAFFQLRFNYYQFISISIFTPHHHTRIPPMVQSQHKINTTSNHWTLDRKLIDQPPIKDKRSKNNSMRQLIQPIWNRLSCNIPMSNYWITTASLSSQLNNFWKICMFLSKAKGQVFIVMLIVQCRVSGDMKSPSHNWIRPLYFK